jgi:preprotein translocase subunit Sss1
MREVLQPKESNMTTSMIIVLTGFIAMVAVGAIIALIMTGE